MSDPRWGDEARERESGSRDLSRGGRGGADSRERERERAEPREVFADHVHLPRGREREHVWVRDHCHMLRGSESRTIASVGAFRVIPADDLCDTFDKPLDPRHGELWHLREAGLVQTVRVDRDTTVVTLTEEGRQLLEANRRDQDAPDRQTFNHGVQRPRELKHDAEVYRAYLEEAERLHEAGATIHRVVLENELKAEYQAFLQEPNRDRDDSDGRPERSLLEIEAWAHEHNLPCDEQGHVQFPDVRIEYDIDGLDHTLDVEVMTPHYRGAHAAAKSGSGFRLHFTTRGGGRGARRWALPELRRGMAVMTFDERVQAVAKSGFTERQARFLTTVMLHAGVCVPRQYARFCGIVHGAKTRKFFAELVRHGYASMYDCRHNRARIYHVNQRALYAAIGEPDSALRRRLTLNRAIQRLMVLDAIVEDPELVWLSTAEEKAAHLIALTAIPPTDLPHVTVGDDDARKVRYFPERLPIGIHLAGRGVIVYVVADPRLDDFRVFLERHATVLRALPAWMLRIVVPPQFPGIGERAKQVVTEQLMLPLRPSTVDELRWYFEQTRLSSRCLDQRFCNARAAYSTPRFRAVYKRWKQDGDASLINVASDAIRKAVETGSGRIEVLELGHRYGHLSPLVTIA